MKQQIIDTMVREKLTHLDELYNSVKHLNGVGKRNEYDEAGLLALVTQLASLTHQPIDNQKVQWNPSKNTSRKVSKYSAQRSNATKRPQNTKKIINKLSHKFSCKAR